MSRRTLVIGDIHGQYNELIRLLEEVRFSPSDRLVFLGDYINRGPGSRDVIDLLLSLEGEHVFLRGNHEEVVLKLLSGEPEYWYTWLEYGGRECLKSYGVNPDGIYFNHNGYYLYDDGTTVRVLTPEETISLMHRIFPPEHIRFFNRTLPFYHEGGFFFCHAGVETGLPLSEQAIYTDYFLIWGDEEFLGDETDYGARIIFGHYHSEVPLISDNKIGLALNRGVAALDLQEMLIIDSDRRRVKIDSTLPSGRR